MPIDNVIFLLEKAETVLSSLRLVQYSIMWRDRNSIDILKPVFFDKDIIKAREIYFGVLSILRNYKNA